MTILRRFWSFVAVIGIGRKATQTIAELRKASLASDGARFTRTYEADPVKLRGGRVVGKLRHLADWTEQHDRPRRRA